MEGDDTSTEANDGSESRICGPGTEADDRALNASRKLEVDDIDMQATLEAEQQRRNDITKTDEVSTGCSEERSAEPEQPTANAEADRSGTDQPAPEPEQRTEPEPEPVKQGFLARLLGSAAGSKAAALFERAFKIPETARTRIFGTGTPVNTIMNALKSSTSLREFMGKDLRHDYTPEMADAYRGFISAEAKSLNAKMSANLQTFMNKIYGGVEQNLIDGTKSTSSKGKPVDLQMLPNAKSFNITEVVDGKLQYNPESGGAILAGLQWLLMADRKRVPVREETVREIFPGVDPLTIERLMVEMDQGMGVTEAKNCSLNRSSASGGIQGQLGRHEHCRRYR